MRVINCLKDLEPYGIYPLTGESCRLFLRVLCDYDEIGEKVLGARYGASKVKFAEPWNSATNNRKHVGSVMLLREDYQSIGVFALLLAGYKWVYVPRYREHPANSVQQLKDAVRGLLAVYKEDANGDVTKALDLAAAAVTRGELALADAGGDARAFGLSPDAVYGFMEREEHEAHAWVALGGKHGYSFSCYVGSGRADDLFRNVHQFSGRTE
jgi:hypothetical protein